MIKWAKKQRVAKKIVKASHIRKRVATNTRNSISISPSKVSRLAKEHRLSSQCTKRLNADKNNPQFDDAVATFQRQFQNARIAARDTIVMDEAGVYDSDIHPYSYEEIGSGGAEIEVPTTGQRDTVVATIRGNGTLLPAFYIQHHRASKQRGKAIKGMNGELMMEYIETVIAPNINGAKQIIMDQLGSHKMKKVVARLEELGLIVKFFPAKTSSRLSPCDNSFFHQYKSIYRDLDHSTPAKKKRAALAAYNMVRPENIVNYFKLCGLMLNRRNK